MFLCNYMSAKFNIRSRLECVSITLEVRPQKEAVLYAIV